MFYVAFSFFYFIAHLLCKMNGCSHPLLKSHLILCLDILRTSYIPVGEVLGSQDILTVITSVTWSLVSSSVEKGLEFTVPKSLLALMCKDSVVSTYILVVERVGLNTLTSYCLSWIGNTILFVKRCNCLFGRKLTTIMSFHRMFLSLINFSLILMITLVLAVYLL